MAMNLGGGFVAGAGADMLQSIILHAAQQQAEQQRIALAQEEARSRDADRAAQRDYQNRSLQSLDDDRKERQAAADEERARRVAADAVAATERERSGTLAAAKETPAGVLLSPEDAALFKKYLPGTLEDAAENPTDVVPGTENPLRPTGKIRFRGTQQDVAKPVVNQPVFRITRDGKMERIGDAPQGSHFATEPAPQQPQIVPVQTVDENGNPVTRFEKKEAGKQFVKPLSATTDARVRSAETVNAIGTDLIAKLSDPKYAATVGPLLGRFGKLRDLIGNPPPELAELAGQIESYALANMGVHGMRSAQGAQAIAKLLDARHTPESLIATIRGLNDFSARFAGANRPKAPASGAATPKTAPKDPLGIR